MMFPPEFFESVKPNGSFLEKRYFIRWQSKATGFTGGETTPFSLEDADEKVARLNKECPDLIHWTSETSHAAAQR